MTTALSTLRSLADPSHFVRKYLGLDPDPWQVRVLLSTHKRVLLNCSRQTGKSTIAAAKALHRALYRKNSTVLLFSPTLRQSSELATKARTGYSTVAETIRAAGAAAGGSVRMHNAGQSERARMATAALPAKNEDNRLSCEFENGSRIVCVPANEANLRGFSAVDLIIEDESAFVDDAVYRAIRPMLAVSGGTLMLMSTPHGKRGHFYEAWESDQPWLRESIPASDCPRISPAFLEEERVALGEWWYRQEYCCEFMDALDSVFSTEMIHRAVSSDVEALQI